MPSRPSLSRAISTRDSTYTCLADHDVQVTQPGIEPGPATELRRAEALLALMSFRGVGPAAAIKLARHFSTWEELARAEEEELRRLVGAPAQALQGRRCPQVAPPPPGVQVLGYWDEDFPEAFRQLKSSPAVVWIRGCLDHTLGVAIVGTRTPSWDATGLARRLAEAAVHAGVQVVSGLAPGIDRAAHEGCLERTGRTVAVIASGVDVPEPKEHTALAQRVVASGGALLSETTPGRRSQRGGHLQRDRLQAALSAAVVVVQCGLQGGTLETAYQALAQHRALLVVEPPEDTADWTGNAALLDPARFHELPRKLQQLLAEHGPATPVTERKFLQVLRQLIPVGTDLKRDRPAPDAQDAARPADAPAVAERPLA